jgi:hypothetical protein
VLLLLLFLLLLLLLLLLFFFTETGCGTYTIIFFLEASGHSPDRSYS